MIINHIFCSNKNLLCKDKSIIEINLQVSSRGSTQIIPSMGCENSTEDQASQFTTAVTLLIYQIYHYFLPWGLIPDEIDEKKWKSVSHVDIIFQNLFEILKRMTKFSNWIQTTTYYKSGMGKVRRTNVNYRWCRISI